MFRVIGRLTLVFSTYSTQHQNSGNEQGDHSGGKKSLSRRLADSSKHSRKVMNRAQLKSSLNGEPCIGYFYQRSPEGSLPPRGSRLHASLDFGR